MMLSRSLARSGQPIEPGHDQDVAFAKRLQRTVELGPVTVFAGDLLLKDRLAAGGFQLGELGFELLAGG